MKPVIVEMCNFKLENVLFIKLTKIINDKKCYE